MVDALAASSAVAQSAATITGVATPPALDFAIPPPAAVLAASGAIAATVASVEAGLVQLNTAFGPVVLRTNLVPPPGTAVQITIVPGTQPGANLFFTSGGQSAVPGPRAAAAGLPAADPTEVVELGQTLQATIVASGSADEAMPLGSALSIRLIPAADPSAAGLAATVIGTAGNATLIDTTLGRLAVDTNLQLEPGTLLTVDYVGPGSSAAPSAPPSGAGLGNGWPALDDALAALDRVAPEIAARMRGDLTPTEAPRLAATLLFLAGTLKGAGAFPPETVSAALSMLGRRELAQRLDKDVGELRRLAADSGSGDWRIYTLPVLDERAVQPIRLYLRPAGDDDPAQRRARGSRFVLDLEMSRLGALQLDGLVRRDRFDLLLRSHAPLAPEAQSELTAIFRDALDGAGLRGNISFSTVAQFPVAPLDALRPRLGVEA